MELKKDAADLTDEEVRVLLDAIVNRLNEITTLFDSITETQKTQFEIHSTSALELNNKLNKTIENQKHLLESMRGLVDVIKES